MRMACLAALPAVAMIVGPGLASTERAETFTCPITGKRFQAVVQTSGTRFGVFLDMRPYGPIMSPDPVPVCPDASRFPVFRTLTANEVARVKRIVATPEYKRLVAASEQAYFIIANIKAALGDDPLEVAHDLVQASWQAEPGSAQRRLYLREARTAFNRIATKPEQTEAVALNARYFEAELSRQLGEFEAALAILDRWFPADGANQGVVGQAFLAQERAAIMRREAAPVLARAPDQPPTR